MGMLKALADMMFADGLTRARDKIKELEVLLKGARAERDEQRMLKNGAKHALDMEAKLREELVREVKMLKSRVEQLVTQNCDLTQRFVVPDVLRDLGKIATGRAKKCPGYYAQLYGLPYCGVDDRPWYCKVAGAPVRSCVTADFSELERRYCAAAAGYVKQPGDIVVKAKPRKKKVYWVDSTLSKQHIYIYCSHAAPGEKQGHFARFHNDEAGQKYADQYVSLLPSME